VIIRTAGYWLLYATVGVLVVLMLLAGGGDLGSEDSRSPIRSRTKVVGALNGMALATMALGIYLRGRAHVDPWWAPALLFGGASAAAVLSVWGWIWIAGDLARRRGGARKRS